MHRVIRCRVLAAFLSITAMSVGCGGPAQTSEETELSSELAQQATRDSCRIRLDGAIRRLNPDSLAAMDRLNPSVGAFNAWLVECAADDLREFETSEANLAFLEAIAQRAVSSPRFTANDVAYIRDSMIASKLAQSIFERANVAGLESEEERLMQVFRWVGNNISLEAEEKQNVSKSFLDTLLTGRGSVRSRIWVLAVLLRQLQYDAVILVPEKAETVAEDGTEFLLAICLADRILLFEPQTWLPVATEGDKSILIDYPAGAEYLNAHEEWKKPQIRIVAQTSAVCPRLLVLQERLPVESSAMLYEELAGGTSAIRPLVDRIVAAAPEAFDATRIAWWDWPDKEVMEAVASDEQQRRKHAALMRPFEAPFEREPVQLDADFQELLSQSGLTQKQRDSLWAQRWEMEYVKMQELLEAGDSEKLFGRPSSRLLKTRLDQIEGNYDRSIIQRLQRIRNVCIDDAITFNVPAYIEPTGSKSIPIPEAIQSVNRQATGSALYWTAMCQMDRSRPDTAITSFASYRRQYPDGEWLYPSLINQALAELAQGRYEAAEKTLTQANQEVNLEQKYVDVLLKRLQAAMTPEKEPATDAVEESTTVPSSSDDSDSSEPNKSEPDASSP